MNTFKTSGILTILSVSLYYGNYFNLRFALAEYLLTISPFSRTLIAVRCSLACYRECTFAPSKHTLSLFSHTMLKEICLCPGSS
jgi:hypothetical protein